MGKTRAIRLSDEDNIQIEEFLNLNPFLDFSNLARTAIIQFIRNPPVQIKPIANRMVSPTTNKLINDVSSQN